MTGNIQNRLAELAAAYAPADLPQSTTSKDAETDAEWAARLERRAERVTRWAQTQDDIAQRYAWMLLLVLEMRQTAKASDQLIRALESSEIGLNAYQRTTRELAAKLAKQHFDRKRGAATKLANDKDGKQAAKAEARELWNTWQEGKLPKVRTVEQFAMEACRRWPALSSIETVKKWAASWRKESGKVQKANLLADSGTC